MLKGNWTEIKKLVRYRMNGEQIRTLCKTIPLCVIDVDQIIDHTEYKEMYPNEYVEVGKKYPVKQMHQIGYAEHLEYCEQLAKGK